jgi:hypothetical protein
MTPIDMLWAAAKAHTIWPNAEFHATTMGNVVLMTPGTEFVVAHLDLHTGVLMDANSGDKYRRDDPIT